MKKMVCKFNFSALKKKKIMKYLKLDPLYSKLSAFTAGENIYGI